MLDTLLTMLVEDNDAIAGLFDKDSPSCRFIGKRFL